MYAGFGARDASGSHTTRHPQANASRIAHRAKRIAQEEP